ncbi:MAG TPA: tyrosine/phenylalanine carboxypeptidase domain-containing protein [Polyangiaceae bacterium]|nr:tyrosine/phenylalanine carboxypeptidase domain-containing protein [Polyangiaceae bacterium]
MSSAAQRLAPPPAWFGQVELVLGRAASEVRILSALTPCDARGERVRLIGELRAGRRAAPRWTYTPRPHDELRRALDWAQGVLERTHLTALEALYLDRARELSLEAAMCGAAGRPELADLARARFEPRDPTVAREASALCAAWLAEPPPPLAEATIASDAPDPASLLSRMRAAVGRLRLPFSVVASPWLAPLAATGERVILVTTGRLVPEEDTARTVLHEIEGHARPRARSLLAASAHFRIGTARGIDDQEGRAVWLEEHAGWLGPRRRKQLAARHWTVSAMLDGASFEEAVTALTAAHGLDAAEAIIVGERAFRGSCGDHPGLGRERVYLESLVRVRRHLAAHPQDDAILSAGQIAVDAVDTLRPFAPPP